MSRSLGGDRERAGRWLGPLAALIALLVVRPAFADAAPQEAGEPGGPVGAGRSAYAEGRFIEALRIWRPLAEQGDANAAFGLGLLYDLGEGVEQDAAAALGWYRRAAEAGYAPAEFNVAVMLDSGAGMARDPTAAALWYGRAAAHGYSRAEYNLALLYQAGDGTPRNADMARRWFAAAAAHGLSAAARKLESNREPTRATTVSAAAAKPALVPAAPFDPLVVPPKDAAASVGVELSWAAPAEPVAVQYFVQVLTLDGAGAHPAFAGFSDRSAVLAALPQAPADYAWRVYTLTESAPDYAASAWSYFSTRSADSSPSRQPAPALLRSRERSAEQSR